MSLLKKTLVAAVAAGSLAAAPSAFAGHGHHHHGHHHHHHHHHGHKHVHHGHHHHHYRPTYVYTSCYKYGWIVDAHGYKKWVCVAW